LANPESLTELLRVPSLRTVCFGDFYFSSALCQATANGFMKGTAVSNLEFRNCSFSGRECAALMATDLGRNISVSHIKVASSIDQALYSALATAFPSNSTLRHLELGGAHDKDGHALMPVILALGKNTGLKACKLDVHDSMEKSLRTTLKDGLETNETLVSLELNYSVPPRFSATRKVSYPCMSTLNTVLRNHFLPHFVATLRPCCKRTRHSRVLSSKAGKESK
jgi:hypothetical protein